MNRRVFIIHGWGGNPENDWIPWVKSQISNKGFEVIVPKMPDTNNPRIEPWIKKTTEFSRTNTRRRRPDRS
ncbi:hypothetical protein HZB78_05395 [Candidatus Collierbacteria bacterium]|nr:hypothetical protein [Candidatus Collierbacteria bacterium]